MAGIVPPSRFIGFSLLSYGYLYLLVLNLFFALLWLLLSSKWFLLPIAAIVVRLGFVPLFFQVGGTDSVENKAGEGQGLLKVLSFNVHCFSGRDFRSGVSDSNMVSFVDIVEAESPDVLVMQEYAGRGDTLHLTESLERMGYHHRTSGNESGTLSSNVLFSKLPIVAVERVDGSSKFYADLMWGGDTVRVYNIHLDSYQLDESDKKQIHDLSHGNVDSTTGRGTLRKFRETILMHEQEWAVLSDYLDTRNRLTVVAGDFNDTPASYFYQQCHKRLVDSYCEVGQGFSATYHGIFTRNASFPAFRIDMVLHTDDLEAVAYRRIKSEISDHHPVAVTLKKVAK